MRRVLVDARWLGSGGLGRVTECLLTGLSEVDLTEEWVAWGDAQTIRRTSTTLPAIHTSNSPLACRGYGGSFSLPRADAYLFLHGLRPARGRPSVAIFHDTIPVRYAATAPKRAFWRLHYALNARVTDRVLTDSHYAKTLIARDLWLSAQKVHVVGLPIDADFVHRVAVARQALRGERARPYVLFYGQFAPHKNLDRLIEAFQLSSFGAAADLHLVGGTSKQLARYESVARDMPRVVVRGRVSEPELVREIAEARVVALPSLEEGYGLPAVEAALAGVPVVTSTCPVFDETVQDLFPRCDPRSVPELARAIDEAVAIDEQACADRASVLRSRVGRTPATFAAEVVGHVEAVLR